MRANAYKIGSTTVIDSSRNLTNIASASANTFLSAAGSAGSPAYQVGDTDSGFYDSGANEVGVSLAGVLEYEFKQAQLDLYSNNLVTSGFVKTGTGTAASPALQIGDDDSGLFDSGANEVGVTLSGVLEYEFTQAQFDMTSNNLVTSGTIVSGGLQLNSQDATNEGGELLLKGAGTNLDLRIDNYAGAFRVFDSASTPLVRLVLDTSGNATIAGRVVAANGTTLKAAYGFASSATTGISYSSTNNRVNILSGGAVRAYVQTGSSTVDTMVVDGSLNVNGAISTTGNLSFGDNGKAIFGAGSDLQIYHSGSASIIGDFGTGDLLVRGENLKLQNTAGENYLVATNNDATRLYYDNAEKLATTPTGIDVTGSVVSDGLTSNGVATVKVTSAGATAEAFNVYNTGSGNNTQARVYFGASEYNTAGRGLRIDAGRDSGADGIATFYSVDQAEHSDYEAIKILTDGGVTLSHLGNNKLATTSTGIDLTGGISATGAATIGSNLTVSNGELSVTRTGDNFPKIKLARTGGTTKTNQQWDFNLGSTGNLNILSATGSTYYPIILTNVGDVNLASDTSGGSPVVSIDQSLARTTFSGGVRVNHSEHQGIIVTASDTSADQNFTAIKIDLNASGSQTTTADRSHIGLFIDVDSSATGGNTSDEHRLYGINADVRASGDSDLVYGGHFFSRADNFGDGNQISNLRGVNAQTQAHHDAGHVATTTGVTGHAQNLSSGTGSALNLWGVYGLSTAQGTSSYTSSSYIGVYGLAQAHPNNVPNIASLVGVRGEVQLDNRTLSAITINNAYCVTAIFDENDADDTGYTINNSYLFYGDYQGQNLATNRFGVFILDDVENRFAGRVRAKEFDVGGTLVIDTSRNLTNIGSISATGPVTIALNASRHLKIDFDTEGDGRTSLRSVEGTASNLRPIQIEGQEIVLSTAAFNQTASVERLRISDAGAITSSGTVTAVSGGNQAELTNLGSLELTRAASNAFIDFKTTTSEDFDCRIQQDSDGLIFVTGGSSTATALTLNNSQNAIFAGNVGINTGGSTPSATLHVIGPAARPTNLASVDTASTAQFQADASNAHSLYIAENASGALIQVNDGATNSTSAKPLALQPFGGDVGIGTGVTAPEETLSVMGDFHVGLNTSVTGRGLKVSTSNDQITDDLVTLNAQASTGVLAFQTNSDEGARLDAAGNFLAGTINTTWQSQEGLRYFRGNSLIVTRDSNEPMSLNRLTTNGDVLIIRKNGTPVGSLGTVSNLLTIGKDNTGIIFNSTSSAIYPWNLSTNTGSNGLIDLGFSDRQWKDLRLAGNVIVNGTSVIDSSRKLVNSTGATIAHSEHEGVTITGTDSSANSAFTSMLIDHNASGSTALTADRPHIALKIDMDSSATGGNTSNEHRLYGIHNSVKATGDSDLIYGIHSTAEAEQTAGQVSSLIGVFGQATTDAVSGQVSNSYGVFGYNSLAASSGTTINNGYALYGKALVSATQDSNISAVHGLYAEVEIDASGAGTTVSTVYGVRSEIDNDAGSADTTISNGYLFYGNYAGDLPTAVYGVYIPDAVRNYFGGNITTGDGSTGTAAYGFNGDENTGMYSPANHQLGFLVNGTQRLLLTGSGATITGDATLGSATTNARLVIQKADDNVPDHIKIFCGGTQTGEIGSQDTTWLRINQSVNKNIYTPRYIRADNGFRVDGTAMGIDGSGRFRAFAGSTSSVGIGFANDIDTGFYRPAANTIDVVTAGDAHARFDSTGNLIVEGNVTAFGSVSDIRLKENVERITDPVEKVKKLDGVTFQYKKTGAKSTGLIAQQLLEVLPEVVYEETDLESGERHYALRYGQVVGLLVEAMKEQQDQIDSLKFIIEEMKNGNNEHD